MIDLFFLSFVCIASQICFAWDMHETCMIHAWDMFRSLMIATNNSLFYYLLSTKPYFIFGQCTANYCRTHRGIVEVQPIRGVNFFLCTFLTVDVHCQKTAIRKKIESLTSILIYLTISHLSILPIMPFL